MSSSMRHDASIDIHTDPRDEHSWLRMLGLALDSATNGIVISANTPTRPIVYCNPAFESLTGYTREEIVGRNCRFLQGEDTDPTSIQAMCDAFGAGRPIDLVILNYKKDGSPFWNALNIGPLRNPNGEVTHFIGIQTDVTERIVTQRLLEERALTDPLTGLPNRARFMRDLDREAESPDMQGRFAVGFVDLDGFKAINVTLSHDAGDDLLKQVARRIHGSVRNNDLLDRLGGDEFVLLLRGVESETSLRIVADRVLAAFQSAFILADQPVLMHASLGFVRHAPGESATGLLTRSDHAMYVAKRSGKNHYTLG